MWMPLVDLDEDMGILKFASRSHDKGYLGTLPISEVSEEKFNRYIQENDMEVCGQKTMRAGDATGLTPEIYPIQTAAGAGQLKG